MVNPFIEKYKTDVTDSKLIAKALKGDKQSLEKLIYRVVQRKSGHAWSSNSKLSINIKAISAIHKEFDLGSAYGKRIFGNWVVKESSFFFYPMRHLGNYTPDQVLKQFEVIINTSRYHRRAAETADHMIFLPQE